MAKAPDPKQLLASLPGPCVVLAPDLTIVDASESYLRATMTFRDEIRGRGMFAVFPDNPFDPESAGVGALRASLQRVIRSGEADPMGVQRYDVRDHVVPGRGWVEKHWAPVNSPVFGAGSNEIVFLIHRVEDVTDAISARQQLREQLVVRREQLEGLKQMQDELQREEAGLTHRMERIDRLLERGYAPRLNASLRPLAEPFASRPYLGPGDRVPNTGVYRILHRPTCLNHSRERVFTANEGLPRCRHCEGVRYQWLRPFLWR